MPRPKKRITKKNPVKLSAFTFPTVMMAGLGSTQAIIIAVAVICVLAALVLLFVAISHSKKKAQAKKAPEQKRATVQTPAQKPAPAVKKPEAPVVEAPVEETPVVEAPAEKAPAEEAPVEEAPVEETPVVEAPVEETPVVETPVEETPVVETPVVETPVVEAPVEETPVEEAPVEEAPVEEAPVVEAAEEEPEIEQEPRQRAPVTLVSTPVVDATGKTTSYTNYKKSFLARIVLAPDDVQERYNTLKNALLSYKKVNARTSWSYESFKAGRTQLAKFAIRGKTLCLYLALDPSTLEDSKYNISDESESKKFDTVPCCLRLTSKRSIKWGLELISKMAENEQLTANPKYKPLNYIPEARSDEEMLATGLIKEIK